MTVVVVPVVITALLVASASLVVAGIDVGVGKGLLRLWWWSASLTFVVRELTLSRTVHGELTVLPIFDALSFKM